MDADIRWVNKRLHPRISWSFIIKFRLHESKDSQGWEVSVIKNISLGGCHFYSNIPYEAGQILDIEIQFPSLRSPMRFLGEVKRREYNNEDKKVKIYGIGIQFLDMDETKKNSFIKTIEFFLRKQSKIKG